MVRRHRFWFFSVLALSGWLALMVLWALPVRTAHAAPGWSASAQASGLAARLSLRVTLQVADADLDRSGSVFVAAVLPSGGVWALEGAHWQPVTGGTLPAGYSGVLGTHTLTLLEGQDVTALAGTVVYAGYGSNAQDMLERGQYRALYTLPGSMSGPATAGDWLSFSLNVQDFAYPQLSAATVERALTLHERLQVPLDVYLTDVMLYTFETQYPSLLNRLRNSPYVALNYHVRPPKPYYGGYDWASLSRQSSAEQLTRIRSYESHVTDGVTGLPGAEPGGFAHLMELLAQRPAIVSFQADAGLYASVTQVFRELGARMTISHSAPYINLGTRAEGLAVRPEHFDLKLFQSPGQNPADLITTGFATARNVAGAASPFVVGVKMHDNDFFAQASAWTTTYVNAPRQPPWNLDSRAALKSDADAQAQWALYEGAVTWAANQRLQVAVVNAQALDAALAAAPSAPQLLVAGTMHIESSRTRWPDPDRLLAFFARATAAGRVGSQSSGMRWSIGADLGWLDGETRAGELVRALSAMGVQWDVHVHNQADRQAAARKIAALGGVVSRVLSGLAVTDIDALRQAAASPSTNVWTAQSTWGITRDYHRAGSEDFSQGLWQARSSADWQAHDPQGTIVCVGGGNRSLAEAQTLADRMASGAAGGYTAPLYSTSLMVDQVTLTVSDAANASTSSDGIDAIETFANRVGLLSHVRWATLDETVGAWKAAGAVPSRIANTQ